MVEKDFDVFNMLPSVKLNLKIANTISILSHKKFQKYNKLCGGNLMILGMNLPKGETLPEETRDLVKNSTLWLTLDIIGNQFKNFKVIPNYR